MKTAITAVLLALLLAGCATNPNTGERELTEKGQIIARSAVRAATVRVIESSTTVDPDRVMQTVTDIRAKVDLDGEATATEMLEVARAVIDFEILTPYEQLLIEDILSLAEARLDSERVGSVTARAGEILDWIESATEAY